MTLEGFLLGGKTPSAREAVVVSWKRSPHAVHISGQEILPTYLGHAREVVDFLRIVRACAFVE